MTRLFAEWALLPGGWAEHVTLMLGPDGRIASVEIGERAGDAERVGILLAAPVNLHSHAFQRAMAGLTERRGPDGRDSFWTWRQLMYRFLDQLSPEDVEAIAALVQIEMLEAGYGAVAEFHYLHHQPGGQAYDDPAEMAGRIKAAAAQTGIGLTLLPVYYAQGGCDGRVLEGGQRRFGCDRDLFAEIVGRCDADLAPDGQSGVAPHSLRAVSREDMAWIAALIPDRPIHIHAAEQVAEVEEVSAAYGLPPIAWLLEHSGLDARWCVIHATQMSAEETSGLAASGAVAGLCPITESNLGDGIFRATDFLAAGGRIGVGSDSNIRISLAEEIRTLEYSQRLRDRGRALLGDAGPETEAGEVLSVGRRLFTACGQGGAQAAGRPSGAIRPGALADLVALDAEALALAGRQGDALLDSWLFASDDRLVRDVWSAGRHVVREGRHVAREPVEAAFRKTVLRLAERI